MNLEQNTHNSKSELRGLQRSSTPRSTNAGRNYSTFIRWMRFALPITALTILAIVVSWTGMEDVVAPIKTENSNQEMGRNELINPRFESQDQKKQPYTITAAKAFQETENMDLILLQKPVADVSLNDGSWIALEAQDGEYRQGAENLLLQKNVKMYHDAGYTLLTDTIVVNIREQTAETESKITGQGPAGQISAQGMKAIGSEARLIFKGPATLILNESAQHP